MCAQDLLGVQKSTISALILGANSRNAIDGGSDAKLGLLGDLTFKRPDLLLEFPLPPGEPAKDFLCFGRARAQGLLVTVTVECLYEIFSSANLLPVKPSSELPELLAEVEKMLIKLDRVDRYPALFGAEFLKRQRVFLSKSFFFQI
ncbi:MAG TPA: hypothetical protein VJ728_10725 [Candidatus Binataceae bacterium]|nr:hypothetical protein [Candidatus Binataceae bacterium]